MANIKIHYKRPIFSGFKKVSFIYHKDIEKSLIELDAEYSILEQRLSIEDPHSEQWIQTLSNFVEVKTYINMMNHLMGR